MFYMMITGIIMAVIASIFWGIEALPMVHKMRTIPRLDTSRNMMVQTYQSIVIIVSFINALRCAWPLILDFACTALLCWMFGFGGMVGGVIGLTMSNVISIFILVISRLHKID